MNYEGHEEICLKLGIVMEFLSERVKYVQDIYSVSGAYTPHIRVTAYHDGVAIPYEVHSGLGSRIELYGRGSGRVYDLADPGSLEELFRDLVGFGVNLK